MAHTASSPGCFTRNAGTINVSNNYSSLQDDVYALGKAGMRPNRLSKFSPSLPWKQFQCGPNGRRPCLVLSKTTVEHSSFYIPLLKGLLPPRSIYLSSTVCYLLVLHLCLQQLLLVMRLSPTPVSYTCLFNSYFLVMRLSPIPVSYTCLFNSYFLVMRLSPTPVSYTCLFNSYFLVMRLSPTPVSYTCPLNSYLLVMRLSPTPVSSTVRYSIILLV